MTEYPEGWVVNRAHWHFHQRLHERYRIVLKSGQFSDILRQINGGRAVPLRLNEYAVKINKTWVYVVAFPERGDLVTVNHPNRLRKNARLRAMEVRSA